MSEKNKSEFLLTAVEVKVDKGKRMLREHRHSRFEIVHFRSGEGIYSVNGHNYSIKPNDIFVFSSNELHCITDIFEPLDFVNIHFEPRFFWGSRFESFSDAGMFFHHSKQFSCRLPRSSRGAVTVANLIEGILRETTDKREEYKMMARSLLTDIMIILIREFKYNDVDENSRKSSSNVKAVKSAMDYIHKHLTEKLTLDDIAENSGMSRSRFSTVFKETMGITLWDYICEKRIELVMQKLEQVQDRSMLDIALECGFNNTANFNKAFKKQTGCTPKDYKMHGNAYIYS